MPYEFVDAPGRYEFVDEPPKKVGIRGEGYAGAMNYSGRNPVAGLVRGAGSIGATLMRPFESSQDNAQRRTAMDEALTSLVGSDPNSSGYQTGKLVAEVGGTMGLGGSVANLIGRFPALAKNIPALLDAIKTGGMSAAGERGLYGAATRVAGGAVNGAITSGLVDPKDAKAGAMLGGAFPAAVQVAGKVGTGAGRLFESKIPPTNPIKLQTARESMDAGYVIPPSMIEPSLKNRAMESISGKHATAQVAATRNQKVSENLVRKGLGLAPDTPISFETMRLYRGAQHNAGYEPLRNVGDIPAGAGFNQSLDDIAKQYTGKGTIPAVQKKDIAELVDAHKSTGFDSGDAVDAIRILREDASELFQKGDNAKAKATRAIADAYETAIDDALKTTGQKDLLKAYREARQNIAKSSTVEKAIREGSGTLDARILARELQKGKPLTGDIKTAAQFANTFDKAAQPPHLIGSPDVGNLRTAFSAGNAGLGAWLGGPLGAAAGASYPFVIPPLVRARMFSKGAQSRLLNQGGGEQGLLGLASDEMLPFMHRSNAVLGGGLIGQ